MILTLTILAIALGAFALGVRIAEVRAVLRARRPEATPTVRLPGRLGQLPTARLKRLPAPVRVVALPLARPAQSGGQTVLPHRARPAA